MSTLNLKNIQLGDNPDPSKNFVLSVPAVADGTLSIKRADGTNVLSIGAETVTVLTSDSDIEAQVKTATSATGSAPIYSCRAWVNFNGTGTVAIRASGNVSSITDNGTGTYTVNFTTAMPDNKYACGVSAEGLTDLESTSTAYLATSFKLVTRNASMTPTDYEIVTATIFR